MLGRDAGKTESGDTISMYVSQWHKDYIKTVDMRINGMKKNGRRRSKRGVVNEV